MTQLAPRTRTFTDDESLLTEALVTVLSTTGGSELLALHNQAVRLAQGARRGVAEDAVALRALIEGLDLAQTSALVQSLTRWFQLLNLAEDNERVRRIEAHRTSGEEVAGSLRQAVLRQARAGVSAATMRTILGGLDLRLVLTAHPTEARRRTVLDKQARIFDLLRDLDERPSADLDRARERLLATVQELWGSDDLRATAMTVADEVQAGLLPFTRTLTGVVPEVYRSLEHALAEAYPGDRIPLPPILTFGTWIGGDRDGNPNVTPQVTLAALAAMREACLRFLDERLGVVAGRISLSERVAGAAPGLAALLADGEARFPAVAAALEESNGEEPYRRVLTLVRERVSATRSGAPTGYAQPAELLADLRAVAASLAAGQGAYTAAGDLHDVIRQVEVFGFHFARLDVREHAQAHRAALSEVLATLRVVEDYPALTGNERCALLRQLIDDHRPLIPADISGFSDSTQRVLALFRMLRNVQDGEHRGAIETYAISGAEGPADSLEVLLLMKEAGLTRAGGDGCPLRIVPLFESGQTLAEADVSLNGLLAQKPYRTALSASGNLQEVLIGYSDSNKDVGYVASCWGTYSAQTRSARAIGAHGAAWMFFHGRGGAVGRGGGPTNVAINALPPGTVQGRVKITEQGEVLARKYALPHIAHRELELALSAVLDTTLPSAQARPKAEFYENVLAAMAERSAGVYRALVHDDPQFVRFFTVVTPVEEISRLRLGSRPAKRPGSGGIEALRAIPWVFAWTQSRIVLPAWYGLGSALSAARAEHGLETLQSMLADWPFFAALLSNAEMALAKADLGIGRSYVELWDDVVARERIWSLIATEFAVARDELLLVRGQERLLDRAPVLQMSIDLRNPYVDPLSYIQVELLRRLRAQGTDVDPELQRVSLLTVNGIAGGLRNTG